MSAAPVDPFGTFTRSVAMTNGDEQWGGDINGRDAPGADTPRLSLASRFLNIAGLLEEDARVNSN